MPAIDVFAVAQRFAGALDRCDFAEAQAYLSEDCHYQIGQETLIGPEAIIASYRDSAEWGRRTLDQVVYESQVTQDEKGLSVLYVDRITHGGVTHEYHCRQHLWLNDAGKVERIVHEELPGEREKLDKFFADRGVRR